MRMLSSMGVSALPYAGGILDQPEQLMDDIARIEAAWQAITKPPEGNRGQ